MHFQHKKHLDKIVRLRAGRERDKGGLFLDRNERVMPHDAVTRKALGQIIANASLHHYPDVDRFYKKLSQWLGIPARQLYVTEGVSGAIKAIIETIARPGDNIIFPTPTFALYPVYCDMFEVEHRTFGYTEDHYFDIDAMMRLMNKRTSIVFLPNPNVPIEGTLTLKEITLIAKRCRRNGTFLAMDEVYYSFGGPTCVPLLKDFDNILIMRSFSKAFGLAGIRIGYVIGSERQISYISKTRTGYETNTASMEIASYFIDHYDIVAAYIQKVKDGVRYLKRELDRRGLEYNGGCASHFIYIDLRSRERAAKIAHALAARRIYVRANWPEPYASGFSVTCGPRPIMERFVKEFSILLKREL